MVIEIRRVREVLYIERPGNGEGFGTARVTDGPMTPAMAERCEYVRCEIDDLRPRIGQDWIRNSKLGIRTSAACETHCSVLC